MRKKKDQIFALDHKRRVSIVFSHLKLVLDSQRRERATMAIFGRKKKRGRRERDEERVKSRNKIIKKLYFSDKFEEKTIQKKSKRTSRQNVKILKKI